MRQIDYIVFHCTATDQTAEVESIKKYWKKIGWKNPGYHHIVRADGIMEDLQPLEKPSNGVKGYNANSIHISYIGGKDVDDRTDKQKETLRRIAKHYKRLYPNAKIMGHRNFPNVKKSCPRYNPQEEYKDL